MNTSAFWWIPFAWCVNFPFFHLSVLIAEMLLLQTGYGWWVLFLFFPIWYSKPFYWSSVHVHLGLFLWLYYLCFLASRCLLIFMFLSVILVWWCSIISPPFEKKFLCLSSFWTFFCVWLTLFLCKRKICIYSSLFLQPFSSAYFYSPLPLLTHTFSSFLLCFSCHKFTLLMLLIEFWITVASFLFLLLCFHLLGLLCYV